jgi:hypothetical protein
LRVALFTVRQSEALAQELREPHVRLLLGMRTSEPMRAKYRIAIAFEPSRSCKRSVERQCQCQVLDGGRDPERRVVGFAQYLERLAGRRLRCGDRVRMGQIPG